MNEQNDRKLSPVIIVVIVLAAVLLIAAVIVFLVTNNSKKQDETTQTTGAAETTEADDDWGSTISYNGETYKLNNNLRTVLFMGIDAGGGNNTTEYGNGGRCDTIILFIMDKSDNTIQMLEMSRNSMVSVDVYEDDGNTKLYSSTMQICLQYSYSDSFRRGSYLMKNKVSETLGGIDIDDYISLQMDGVPIIVDAIGGVTITMEEDCTDIDPSYTEGATVTMDGEQAEEFVRYRGHETGANENTRMSNQAWFLKQLFAQMKGIGGTKIASILDETGDYMYTDMFADDMAAFLKYSFDGETLTVPGEVQGGALDEFIIDNDALKEQLVNLFYVKQ